MRHVDEFADPALARRLIDEIHRAVTRPWAIMEVCGGQTHSIVRHGLDQLLPAGVELLHGPGCPVCVTPLETLDRAMRIASRPEVVLCTFGDMVRVPGSHDDLAGLRSRGADVRVVSSPLDAVTLARQLPDRQVVFLAVGFETTAPATALAVQQAHRQGLRNVSFLVSHVLVPPAIEAILTAPGSRVQAFLAAGHVCTVMGTAEYEPLVERHGVPIVVAGFEPLDLLDALRRAILQLEGGRAEVENAYPRAVAPDGNLAARAAIADVFEVCDRSWRGIGPIPASGWQLTGPYRSFDAEHRFDVGEIHVDEPDSCLAGQVLQGRITPLDCPEFGVRCTPETPLGATMVSGEGTCAAYYAHRRRGALRA